MLKKVRENLYKNSRLTSNGFLIYSPISILGFPVSVLIVNPKTNFLIAFLGGLLLTIVTYLFYLILILLMKRNKSSELLSLYLFFLIPTLTGTFRGIIFYNLIYIFELTQPSGLLNRITSSTLTTLFWLAFSNYIVNISRNFTLQYQSALHQYLLGRRKQFSNAQLSEENLAVLENLQNRLKVSVQNFLDKNDPSAFRSLSSVLIDQINDQIRPLSRRIFVRSFSELPVFKYKQLLKDSLQTLDFSWKTFFGIILILSLSSNLVTRGILETILRTSIFLIPLFLLLLVLNTFKSKNSIYLNLILLIFLGVIPIFTSEYLIHVLGYGGSWIATAAIMPIVPVLIYVLSLQRLTQKDRDLVIEKLLESAEVNQNSLPGEFELESASIASYLHNSLQSELLALSRQLELAAEKMDPVTSSKLMERISNRVNRNLAEDFQLFADSSFNRLDAVIESWKGILDITIDFPNNLTRESKKFPILVQTIEEVSSNISRYDFATKLRVTAECHDDSILLTFQSDGKGKLVKSRGSGSIWLNRVAISEWTIEKNHKGTQISIEI
ncbi:MAG: hypothetical protein RI944_413 [Actinomycetota bacterium]